MDTAAESLHALLISLRQTPPRLILSPPTQPRRASVALIIRLKPAPGLVFEGHEPEGYTGPVIPADEFGLGLGIDDFFRLDWVNHPETVPELLFIRRAPSSSPSSSHSRWSSQIAFPGGRQEATDESALYTALRETWEEIGIDLAEKEFVQVGRLDEREITTSLGKRLIMILSPFVFLQTTPFSPSPELQATEVSSVHWIPMTDVAPPFSTERWSFIEIDISTRLSPRNQLVRWALRGLVGQMQFGCLLLPDEPDHMADGFDVDLEFEDPPEGSGSWYNHAQGKRMLRLWGLTLGMTLDLLAHAPDAQSPLLAPMSNHSSPTRDRANSFGPRTPVTVTSSFDDAWDAARKAIEVAKDVAQPKPQAAESSRNARRDRDADAGAEGVKDNGEGSTNVAMVGEHGAGLKGRAGLGSKIDVKVKNRRRGVGPGVTAVFPRFTYPDVNFWIWVFGRRYRQVIKGWEASVRGPDRAADRRTNWSGAALSTFYTAVRHAIVVAIIIRGIATVGGIAGMTWFVLRRLGSFSEL